MTRTKAAPLDLAINYRGDKVIVERLSQWLSLEFALEDYWYLFSSHLEGPTFLYPNSFHQGLYDCICQTDRNLQNVVTKRSMVAACPPSPPCNITASSSGTIGTSTVRTIQWDVILRWIYFAKWVSLNISTSNSNTIESSYRLRSPSISLE